MRSSSSSKSRTRTKARLRKRARLAASNRRRHRRLRMDRIVRVPVQVFPVLPFVGQSVDGALVNLSPGGMALLLGEEARGKLIKGHRLSVHFRLPGMPLVECRGLITHAVENRADGWVRLGVKFLQSPAALVDRIHRMMLDDEACEARATAQASQPRCDLACSFHSLCHKPIREASAHAGIQFEISLQRLPR